MKRCLFKVLMDAFDTVVSVNSMDTIVSVDYPTI